jgi:hypothetical protein
LFNWFDDQLISVITQSAIVRFSGAQNAHIKISRFWWVSSFLDNPSFITENTIDIDVALRETLPQDLQPVLLQQTLTLTSRAASPDSPYRNENNIVLRKLFSSVSLLMSKLPAV